MAAPGHTPPAGSGGLSSFGALGRVSRSGRFRNRASDPRPPTVRGSTLSRAEASGPGPAAADRSSGSFTGPANQLSRTTPPAWRRTTPDPGQRGRSLPAGRRDSSRGKSRPDTPCVAFSPCVDACPNRGTVSICGTAPLYFTFAAGTCPDRFSLPEFWAKERRSHTPCRQ